MLRFRRYRVFLICAILMTIALVRLSRSRQYENEVFHRFGGAKEGYKEENYDRPKASPSKEEPKKPPVDVENLTQSSAPYTPKLKITAQDVAPFKTSLVPISLVPTPTSLIVAPLAEEVIPDRTMTPPSTVSAEEDNEIHQIGPGRVTPIEFSQTPQVIHWEKQVEHFPIPTESIIQLPTGKPISIPKIQYQFSDETVMARAKREERLGKVKEEFKRAWNGYKTYAWMHDELSPVSGGYRDPFAGWAATLVDSLDTLSIMGLDEDFEEAVRAVGNIDFTTAKRPDIQVFETTIRYLGGLLAAYDVSGGTKKILLDKAVELGEVIMGAFDTPNRMPVLYYNWKPAFASQPHRASTRSNLAELGSLAMEFTHLAQLTKKAKYYDAVARITNALFEWQNRGTTGLRGVFPQDVDASGCNRSAPVTDHALPPLPSSTLNPVDPLSADGEGYQPPTPKTVKEPRPVKGKGAKELADIELSVIPGEPSKAELERILPKPEAETKILSKRTEPGMVYANTTLESKKVTDLDQVLPASPSPTQSIEELAREMLRTQAKETQTRGIGDWDCVPMGLESANYGRDSFSLGGSQDSTYEYFSKQYLLLGGLEDKYRALYLGTMEAVRDHMLYRPMVPNNRDLLFSGRITKNGNAGPSTFEPEVTHLTCFLGGMVGMGAKIFGLEEHDIEIAKKLADGCVWAYESMDTGIMPESAEVYLCQKDTDCQWNETLWRRSLDPMADKREQLIEDYEIRKANRKAQEEQAVLAAQEKAKLEAGEAERFAATNAEQGKSGQFESDQVKSAEANSEPVESKVTGDDPAEMGAAIDVDVDSLPPISTRNEEVGAGSVSESQPAFQKRQLNTDPSDTSVGATSPPPEDNGQNDAFQKKLQDTEIELQGAAPGRQIQNPSKYVPKIPAPSERGPDPMRPPTHKEYVDNKIKREGLAPGFTRIKGSNYILRPEAIESVWYMYRITGDPIWQEKGWTMFEHIINATSTTYGHSAIRGVSGEYGPEQTDEMESFWLAETLKYFYLLYSPPDVISLDDWVLNTEAHPFKRPK